MIKIFLLSTQFGKCIRFKSKKLRLFKGRSSKGIKGIKLNDKDKVISLSILDNSKISSKVLIKIKKLKMLLINLFYLYLKMVMVKELHILIIGLQIEGEKVL